jgi:hypothetical protein
LFFAAGRYGAIVFCFFNLTIEILNCQHLYIPYSPSGDTLFRGKIMKAIGIVEDYSTGRPEVIGYYASTKAAEAAAEEENGWWGKPMCEARSHNIDFEPHEDQTIYVVWAHVSYGPEAIWKVFPQSDAAENFRNENQENTEDFPLDPDVRDEAFLYIEKAKVLG